jgi:hypothetical protein
VRRSDSGSRGLQVSIAIAATLLFVLAGCQSPAPIEEREPPRAEEPEALAALPPPVEPLPPPIPTPGESALEEGIALYDAGNFNGAIKRLRGAKEIWTDSTTLATANKVAAHKYLAFSYCVTKRRTQCRQQFVDALRLDPGFSLEPAEKTHPIWGPEFERAKKQASAPAAPAKRPARSPGSP